MTALFLKRQLLRKVAGSTALGPVLMGMQVSIIASRAAISAYFTAFLVSKLLLVSGFATFDRAMTVHSRDNDQAFLGFPAEKRNRGEAVCHSSGLDCN